MEPEEPIAVQRIERWARAREDIRGAILIGSRARTDHPADEFSDIDVLLLVRDPDALADDAHWPGELGEVAITFVEGTPVSGIRERRVLFQDGTDVDFAIVPVERVAEVGETGSDTLARGYRVLVDKDGALVVRMLKWHTGGRDTWHEGRFLEEWCDPRALTELRSAYAHYDTEDVKHALVATMDLYSWLARETGDRLGFSYPADEEKLARRLTQQVLRSASWR